MKNLVRNVKFEVEWLRANDRDQDTTLAHFKMVGKRFGGYGPDWWCEYLYRTARNNYFVYAVGGAQSKYGRPNVIGGWVEGDAIIPLPSEEILAWCQDCLEDMT